MDIEHICILLWLKMKDRAPFYGHFNIFNRENHHQNMGILMEKMGAPRLWMQMSSVQTLCGPTSYWLNRDSQFLGLSPEKNKNTLGRKNWNYLKIGQYMIVHTKPDSRYNTLQALIHQPPGVFGKQQHFSNGLCCLAPSCGLWLGRRSILQTTAGSEV